MSGRDPESYLRPRQFSLPLIEECLGVEDMLSPETLAGLFEYIEARCKILCTDSQLMNGPRSLACSPPVKYHATTGEVSDIRLALATDLVSGDTEVGILLPLSPVASEFFNQRDKNSTAYVYAARLTKSSLSAGRDAGLFGMIIQQPTRYNLQSDMDLFMDSFRFIEGELNNQSI